MELIHQLVDWFRFLVDLFLHLDVHLNQLVTDFGLWTYAILFLVIFCETGLVVTPILPGDSLLFAVGALAAIEGSPLDIWKLAFCLYAAACLGDLANYSIGRKLGPRVFSMEGSRLLNKAYLTRAQEFYETHGGKTLILARFIPIIRTFAPFVAGIGKMRFARFIAFSWTGSLLWIPPFLYGGYRLGNLPEVKANFHYVVVAVVLISVMPAVIQYLRQRLAAKRPA